MSLLDALSIAAVILIVVAEAVWISLLFERRARRRP